MLESRIDELFSVILHLDSIFTDAGASNSQLTYHPHPKDLSEPIAIIQLAHCILMLNTRYGAVPQLVMDCILVMRTMQIVDDEDDEDDDDDDDKKVNVCVLKRKLYISLSMMEIAQIYGGASDSSTMLLNVTNKQFSLVIRDMMTNQLLFPPQQ